MGIAKKIVEEVGGRALAVPVFILWRAVANLSVKDPPLGSRLKGR